MRALAITALLVLTVTAGCIGGDDTIRIAFVAKDTATAPHDDLERLEAFLTDQTGARVEVDFFTTSTAALEAVRAGQADIASVDGAAGWLAWQRLDLEAVAAEVRGDGRTFYMAAAWVRADSDIQDITDFEGRTSCHTGATKSAGMMLPMSYLIQEGLIDTAGYDDISDMVAMAEAFFDEPVIGGAYEGYNGALQCLSEGVGDIAFIRDTTPADYCTPGDAEPWCLDLADYRKVIEFGQVPEHPFMVSPDLEGDKRTAIVDAFLALNDSDEGRDILDKTFGTGGIAAVTTEAHLGDYGSLISNLPGIEAYAEGK